MEFNGDLKDLSEVDQFVYRMTKLPGYLDRLKAIQFKSTFDEKCAEVEKVCTPIKSIDISLVLELYSLLHFADCSNYR